MRMSLSEVWPISSFVYGQISFLPCVFSLCCQYCMVCAVSEDRSRSTEIALDINLVMRTQIIQQMSYKFFNVFYLSF